MVTGSRPLPANARARGAARVGALALAAATCREHDVQLVLALHGLAPAADDVVDVYVVGACPSAGRVGGEPTDALLRESFAYGTTPTPLGALQAGHVGVYARVRSTAGTCAVRAAGCTDVARLDATTVVDVALVPCVGAACPGAPSSPSCPTTQCPDGGDPSPEVCDAVDNNCNGLIDENLTMGCQVDACTPGVQTCVSGRWTVCVATAPQTCASAPPTGTCGDAMGVMLMHDTPTVLRGTTCGAPDHFAIPNDAPCTPDAVFVLQQDTLSGPRSYGITSNVPVALFAACDDTHPPYMCGTSVGFNGIGLSGGLGGSVTMVVEAPDGGCGPFTVMLAPN